MIKDNLGKYKSDQQNLVLELKKSQNQLQLTEKKVQALENENALKDQALLKMEQVMQNQAAVQQKHVE